MHKLAELFQLIKMAKTSWYVLAGQNPHLRQLGYLVKKVSIHY